MLPNRYWYNNQISSLNTVKVDDLKKNRVSLQNDELAKKLIDERPLPSQKFGTSKKNYKTEYRQFTIENDNNISKKQEKHKKYTTQNQYKNIDSSKKGLNSSTLERSNYSYNKTNDISKLHSEENIYKTNAKICKKHSINNSYQEDPNLFSYEILWKKKQETFDRKKDFYMQIDNSIRESSLNSDTSQNKYSKKQYSFSLDKKFLENSLGTAYNKINFDNHSYKNISHYTSIIKSEKQYKKVFGKDQVLETSPQSISDDSSANLSSIKVGNFRTSRKNDIKNLERNLKTTNFKKYNKNAFNNSYDNYRTSDYRSINRTSRNYKDRHNTSMFDYPQKTNTSKISYGNENQQQNSILNDHSSRFEKTNLSQINETVMNNLKVDIRVNIDAGDSTNKISANADSNINAKDNNHKKRNKTETCFKSANVKTKNPFTTSQFFKSRRAKRHYNVYSSEGESDDNVVNGNENSKKFKNNLSKDPYCKVSEEYASSSDHTNKEIDLFEIYSMFYKEKKFHAKSINFDLDPRHEALILRDFFCKIEDKKNKSTDFKNLETDIKKVMEDFIEVFNFVNVIFIRRIKKECFEFAPQQHEISTRTLQFIKNLYSNFRRGEKALKKENGALQTDLDKEREEKKNYMIAFSNLNSNGNIEDQIKERENKYNKLAEKVRYLKKKNKVFVKKEQKYLNKLNDTSYKQSHIQSVYKNMVESNEKSKRVYADCFENLLSYSLKTQDKDTINHIYKLIQSEKLNDLMSVDQMNQYIGEDDTQFHEIDFQDMEKLINSDTSHETQTDKEESEKKFAENIKFIPSKEHADQYDKNAPTKKPHKLFKSSSFFGDSRNKTLQNPFEFKPLHDNAQTDTHDLVLLVDQYTQTNVTLVDNKYDLIFNSQKTFIDWFNRSMFQQELMNKNKDKNEMHFVKDPKMRMMLVSLYKKKDQDELLENIEKEKEVAEKKKLDELEKKAELAKKLKSRRSVRPFDYQNDISNRKANIEANVSDRIGISKELWTSLDEVQQIEELIDSYAFEANKVKNLSDKLNEKEKHFTNLVAITKKMNYKIQAVQLEYDNLKLKMDKYFRLHNTCNITKETLELTKKKFSKSKLRINSEKRIDAKNKANDIGEIDNKAKKLERELKRKGAIEKQAKVSEERIDDQIDKIKIIYQLKTTDQMKSNSLRSLYKAITNLITEKVTAHHINPNVISISIRAYIDKYFADIYGDTQMSQKKLRELLISCFQYKSNQRVLIFSRFLKLIDDVQYTLSEEQMYLSAMDYMLSSNKGIPINSDYEIGYQYFPIIRVKDYIQYIAAKKLPVNYILILKQEINNRKVVDNTFENPDGLIDFDLFMSSLFGIFRMCLANEIVYLKVCVLNVEFWFFLHVI